METDNSKRNDRLLRKKLRGYLIPMMLTMAAFSLSEFVDIMIVSNLLGSKAVAEYIFYHKPDLR